MDLTDRPGFHRRFMIIPRKDEVVAALEDEIHCMAVTLKHDGDRVLSVAAEIDRAPWDTCPGAMAMLRESFAGVSLAHATERGGKRQNCTHLYDLAELAAAHAHDDGPMRYDILVVDPVDGTIVAELRRNGALILVWTIVGNEITAPPELAGASLLGMRDRLAGLAAADREAARILQWASLVAHGRRIPWEYQADAKNMPANCYSFQPGRAVVAKRTGVRHDFSAGDREPLSHFDGARFTVLEDGSSGA